MLGTVKLLLQSTPCSPVIITRQRIGKNIKRFTSNFPSSVESDWGLGKHQKGEYLKKSNLQLPVLPRFRNMTEQYNRAIQALNSGLQTNFAVLEQVKKERREQAHLRLEKTFVFLEQSGMTLQDLDSLGVIHISGTKGKGSTCAFCESVLRQRGLKTGLFTSPHLLSVTERIRINGEPIDKALFAHYFWMVYDRIVTPNPPNEKPIYFQFLTILAFNIFWREGVDVAIMEVGVGGRFDSTNVVRSPVVCGITTLDIDHTSILGKTIEEIAWQKAGIMKPGVSTLIDGCQTKGALNVLSSEAEKIGSPIEKVPQLDSYDWRSFPAMALGGMYSGKVYQRNASLALQLSRRYYEHFRRSSKHQHQVSPHAVMTGQIPLAQPFRLETEEAVGLRLCKWPGRAQVIRKNVTHNQIDVMNSNIADCRGDNRNGDSLVYFLDGAHTKLSMESCVQWFNKSSQEASEGIQKKLFKVLVFNLTKDDREARPLLQMLRGACSFDLAVFTPNAVRQSDNVDNVNNCISIKSQLDRCRSLVGVWNDLDGGHSSCEAIHVETINEGIEVIHRKAAFRMPEDIGQTQVLVTGSLLLLGNMLQIVEPHLAFKCDQEEEKKVLDSYAKLSGKSS